MIFLGTDGKYKLTTDKEDDITIFKSELVGLIREKWSVKMKHNGAIRTVSATYVPSLLEDNLQNVRISAFESYHCVPIKLLAIYISPVAYDKIYYSLVKDKKPIEQCPYYKEHGWCYDCEKYGDGDGEIEADCEYEGSIT